MDKKVIKRFSNDLIFRVGAYILCTLFFLSASILLYYVITNKHTILLLSWIMACYLISFYLIYIVNCKWIINKEKLVIIRLFRRQKVIDLTKARKDVDYIHSARHRMGIKLFIHYDEKVKIDGYYKLKYYPVKIHFASNELVSTLESYGFIIKGREFFLDQ